MTTTETFSFSALDSLNYHLKSIGQNVDELWKQIDEAVASITLLKSAQISRHVNFFHKMKSEEQPKYFELLRFDFLLDDDMNIHLMEVCEF